MDVECEGKVGGVGLEVQGSGIGGVRCRGVTCGEGRGVSVGELSVLFDLIFAPFFSR
jgi:hypothetical protein